jgi:lysyl-tRNA synthetase, class II
LRRVSERLKKVERLRAEGVDPYPRSFPDRTRIATILAAHDPEQLGAGEHSRWSYRIAGRLTGKRGHGKTAFFDLRDLSGSMQAYARRDAIGDEAFERIEDLDIGDMVGVEGDLYVTKRGQLALEARECTLLAKSLRDPPDLFHGISDPETRYRHRELDLMANERTREIFLLRAKLIAAIRGYMNEHDFVELETPTLQRLAGGAAARPFKTHHNALSRDFVLRISSELHLKRTVVGGFENVYELGKFFRNEGISPQHNPEFTMMEWFKVGAEYKEVMAFTEGLVSSVVEQVLGTTKVEREGRETLDFAAPWRRLSRGDPRARRGRHPRGEQRGACGGARRRGRPQGRLGGPGRGDPVEADRADPGPADLPLRPAAGDLAPGAVPPRAPGAGRGLRRDRRRDRGPRRGQRHQRPGRTARALRRTAQAPGGRRR